MADPHRTVSVQDLFRQAVRRRLEEGAPWSSFILQGSPEAMPAREAACSTLDGSGYAGVLMTVMRRRCMAHD